jgi:hypothetical protein
VGGGPPPVAFTGGAWRAAMTWRGVSYGDVVEVPLGHEGHGTPSRSMRRMADGSYIFIEYVTEAGLEEFLDRMVAGEARVLPVRYNAHGKRDRSLQSVVGRSREEYMPDIPEPRTASWCLLHLSGEGRGLESHFEHFRSLCNLQVNQWGMEEYGNLLMILRSLMFVDQLDPANLVGVELIFRRLQTIEYSYSDKLREKSANTTGGRLTMDEQAAFGAMARVESKLMICPALLEAARAETEKEAGLAKSLLKARQARADLAKKQ